MESIPNDHQTSARGWRSWSLSVSFWGGITLVLIWMAVLFVGIFGGNIDSANVDGSSSSWPVVLVVAIVALLATISVGRWAFRPSRVEEDPRSALADERRTVEELTAEVDDLRLELPRLET